MRIFETVAYQNLVCTSYYDHPEWSFVYRARSLHTNVADLYYAVVIIRKNNQNFNRMFPLGSSPQQRSLNLRHQIVSSPRDWHINITSDVLVTTYKASACDIAAKCAEAPSKADPKPCCSAPKKCCSEAPKAPSKAPTAKEVYDAFMAARYKAVFSKAPDKEFSASLKAHAGGTTILVAALESNPNINPSAEDVKNAAILSGNAQKINKYVRQLQPV